jgi:hypothetical protein
MTEEDDEIERAVAALRRTLEQRVDPDVAARHISGIHREAARIRLAKKRSLRAARRPRVAVLAALVGALLVGSSSMALAASDTAIPGDLLYPVKRSSEEVQLLVAVPFSNQGEVQLEIAAQRVEEARRAAEVRPDVVPQLVAAVEEACNAAVAAGAPQAEQVASSLRLEAEQALALAVDGEGDEVAGVVGGAPEDTASIPLETDTTGTEAIEGSAGPGGTLPGDETGTLVPGVPGSPTAPAPGAVVPPPGGAETATAGASSLPAPSATPTE